MSSFKSRYFFKLVNNFLGALLSLVNINLSTRALNPEALGQFDFSNQTNTLIISFLSVGLGTTFFNWMSREEKAKALAGLFCYLGLMLVIFIIHLGIYSTVSIAGIQHVMWPGLSNTVIILGLLFAELTFALQAETYWSDGQAKTVGAERIKMIISLLRTGATVILYVTSKLTLLSFYGVQITALVANIVLLFFWLWKECDFKQYMSEWRHHIQSVWAHIKIFGGPLVVYGLISVVYEYADTWLLQFNNGSTQQGYYGLGNRLAGVIFLFSSALTPIFTREIANAHSTGKTDYFMTLFDRIRIPVAITSFIGCFAAVFAPVISMALGGKGFSQASTAVALMCLYPIHQTFGQLVGSIFFGLGKTALYARVGLINLTMGMCLSYLMLAPSSGKFLIPGLGLGANGLAIKMVVAQFIGTNISLYITCRILQKSYYQWFRFQLEAILVPIALALCVFQAISMASKSYVFNSGSIAELGSGAQSYLILGLGAGIYGLCMSVIIWLRPSLLTMTRSDILRLLSSLKPGS